MLRIDRCQAIMRGCLTTLHRLDDASIGIHALQARYIGTDVPDVSLRKADDKTHSQKIHPETKGYQWPYKKYLRPQKIKKKIIQLWLSVGATMLFIHFQTAAK